MTLPGGPEEVDRTNIVSPVGAGTSKLPTEGARSFQSYMQGTEPNPMLSCKPVQASPFDLVQGNVLASGPTNATILEQAKSAHMALGDVSNQLNTPKLKLRPSTRYILKSKLSSANAQIRSAASKVGVQPGPAKEAPPGSGPLQKFINLVTDGQTHLEETQAQIQALNSKGENLTPGDMLLVQVKLNKAQVEIEFSSLLLGKAIDDLKMMMNVQL